MKNIALYFTVLIIGLTTSLQAQNTNVPYQVWNTVSRTYDTEIRYYNAGNIASDYGPRILDGRHDWHGGVDFSAADVDEDLNYRILALYAGRVVRFVTTSSYYLMIDAQDVDPATQQVVNRDLDLAYVHIFRNGDQASNMLRGEFIIRPIDGFPNQYAILNTRTEVAIGVCPTNNCSGLTVTYGGQQYSVSNNVIQGQAIAPVGDSYGGQGNLSAHLHLQAVANTTGGIADGNDMNPLAYVTYPAPTYDFNIFTKMPNATAIEGLSVNYPSSVNSSSADTKTPIKLRVSLVQGQSAGQNATSNRIMDIERVELNMVPVNGRTRTTPVAHYYNYIVGTNLASTIQYGGIRRTQPNRYPTQIQVATGSWTSQGIYDNAYNSEDDFYFTDFAPRMNKNNHAQLAKLPDDAQYNDGAYALYPAVYNVSDTRVQPNDANVVFYIDNFKPYIKNVKVRRNDATSTLLCESNWSASSDRACIQLDNYRSPYTISSNQEYDLMMASSYPVKIVVTTSEPLKDLKMSIPLIGLPTTVSSNSNDLETEFTFTISSSQLRQMIQLQNPSNFNFIGKDYEDNSLLALQPQQLTCVNIPKRLSSGWADDMAQGTDVSHAAYIKLGSGCTRGFRSENPSNTTSLRQSLPGACIYVDFKYTIGNNGEVKFTDMSSGQTTISNWQWIFGDGGSISQQHPTHRYNTLGATTEELCFDVKLTATDISGNTGSETKHICIPVLSNGSMYVKILNPVPVYESSCIKEWVKATTGQQMRFEGSVLGGTPPYTFDWRIAGAQATPSVISGPGPHYVTFTTATSGGLDLCSREGAIQLTVKDANNVIKTTSVRLNVRSSAIDGPGNLKIVCSKDAPCENEEVSLTVKSQDPFGFVFPETYKWFIDNVEQPEIFKKIKRKFTPGTHDVRVEVTDGGGSIYRVGPLTLAVKTTLECNSPGTVSPRFQILVNNQVGGGNPLTLEAANPCSADGSIDPTTGGKTSKIHIRVPNLGTSTARDNSLLRQVPDYFFVFSVEYNGVTKPLTIGGGYGSLSNVLTEKWLITNNYRPRVNGSFLEYPIPLCFANCAPLFGNSRLVVSVGRFAEEKIQQRCVPEAVLPPTDITSRCMGVAGVDYFVSLCANFIETMTNENLQVQVCRSPTITGAVCQQLTRPETILQREVIKDMKTGYYDIFVKHDAPPLSISNIQSTITCASVSLSTTVSGGVNQVPNLDANNPSFCAASTPYSVRWQIFDYNNPLVEITGNIFLTANNIPNPSINLQHPYFNTFGANDNKLFIAQITAIDLLGNRAIGTQIVKISPPIKINLPDVINRCPSNNTTLTNGATVVGGTPPYRFIWSSTSNVFMEPPTSTTSNPLLKLIGLPSPTVVIDLTVSDANGCSVRKNIVLNVNNLKSFSMNTSSLTACADESSKLIIGPLNCTPTTLKECLGGSGEYNFRWACNDPEGLGKLSDPTSAFPRVIGIIDRTVNYRLFVSDANGGCGEKMSTNEVMVRGEQVFFTVNLGADKILCAGDKSVTLKADTRSGGASFSTGFTYEWQSDKPNFSTSY